MDNRGKRNLVLQLVPHQIQLNDNEHNEPKENIQDPPGPFKQEVSAADNELQHTAKPKQCNCNLEKLTEQLNELRESLEWIKQNHEQGMNRLRIELNQTRLDLKARDVQVTHMQKKILKMEKVTRDYGIEFDETEPMDIRDDASTPTPSSDVGKKILRAKKPLYI